MNHKGKINFGSLFWKLILPIIVLFSLTIIALGFYIPSQINDRAIEAATSASKQTAKQFKVLRKYYVQNILNKVTAGSDMRPAINHKDNPDLDRKSASDVGYCVFGQVVNGMDVVDEIRFVATARGDVPDEIVLIESVEVH